MKKIISLAGLLLFYLLSFAQNEEDIAHDSVLIEEHYRVFHFKKPPRRNSNTGSSLVFIMHGSGGTGMGIRKAALKLEAKADDENFIIVYPDGYKNFWNDCRKASASVANQENINEQAFFSAMIDYFKMYGIDTKKVFAAGMSGGGHMAYKLAMTIPDQFRAITAVVANLPDSINMDCGESKKRVAVMIINGTADPVNPDGGGEVKTGIVMGTVRSTEQSFQYWARIDGYKGVPEKSYLPDTDPDGKTIEKYTYKSSSKPDVILLKVINGKHEHPTDIDAYSEAWKFFKRQMKKKY
jgi:polyhydroxybutyrate depolymerase